MYKKIFGISVFFVFFILLGFSTYASNDTLKELSKNKYLEYDDINNDIYKNITSIFDVVEKNDFNWWWIYEMSETDFKMFLNDPDYYNLFDMIFEKKEIWVSTVKYDKTSRTGYYFNISFPYVYEPFYSENAHGFSSGSIGYDTILFMQESNLKWFLKQNNIEGNLINHAIFFTETHPIVWIQTDKDHYFIVYDYGMTVGGGIHYIIYDKKTLISKIWECDAKIFVNEIFRSVKLTLPLKVREEDYI